MVHSSTIPAAVSVIWDGKTQIAQCPPVPKNAMTMVDVWTGSACVIRATQEKTAASWCVQMTATTKATAWMESVCVSHTSWAKTAASTSVPTAAVATVSVWTAGVSVMKVFMGKIVH